MKNIITLALDSMGGDIGPFVVVPAAESFLTNNADSKIILVGDETAARNITHVEIPSLEGGYNAFYNPGGPGPEPFEGVRYTAPGPADLEPVINALDNPMRVSREAKN